MGSRQAWTARATAAVLVGAAYVIVALFLVSIGWAATLAYARGLCTAGSSRSWAGAPGWRRSSRCSDRPVRRAEVIAMLPAVWRDWAAVPVTPKPRSQKAN